MVYNCFMHTLQNFDIFTNTKYTLYTVGKPIGFQDWENKRAELV